MSTLATTTEAKPLQVACAHCGLPAPAPEIHGEPSFCCRGCRGAYELIRGWGLEEYYELRDSPGEVVSEPQVNYDDLDDPRLLGHSAPLAMESSTGRPLLKSTLAISGLHCAACIWLIERTPERIDGWHSAQVSMRRRTAEIVFDPSKTRLSEIARYLHRIGYEVAPLHAHSDGNEAPSPERGLLVNIAFAGFCAANAMWVAIALYAGEFTGIAASHAQLLRTAGVLLGAAAVLFPGRIFFRSAAASLASRTPHMDLPVALGLAAGLLASVFALFNPEREVYFDSIAALVFFLLTGRWLQMRQQRRAGEAVSELIRISPSIATRLEPSGERTRIPVDELTVGETIVVGPSESVPVDGIVVKGQSTVDRSLLTGESSPVPVAEGVAVEAGTDNVLSDLFVRVTAVGDDTKLAEIQRSVTEASETRTPIVQLANRIGAWFVVVVLALAVITAVIWWRLDPSQAVNHVVALLIVACPCALALATPLAIAVGIGRLAKDEVLVRSGDCLERLSKPGTVFFDKTGTLTGGRMRVSHWFGSEQVLDDVAVIETNIHHPIAQAIVSYRRSTWEGRAEYRDVPLDQGDVEVEVEQDLGRGVRGRVDARHYTIGSPRLFEEGEGVIDQELEYALQTVIDVGSSPVVVLRDGVCCGVLGVQDPLREDARSVVDSLRKDGWRVAILSGDHRSSVNRVAIALGVDSTDAHGGMLPVDKLDAVRAASSKGPVVMVGDGVNDAAALAAADVGVAVRGGARASLSAAPVVIGHGRLRGVVDLIEGSNQTRRTIRRNFAISIGYNVVAVALAMGGSITPLIAAALMPASSLTVLGLTLAPTRKAPT